MKKNHLKTEENHLIFRYNEGLSEEYINSTQNYNIIITKNPYGKKEDSQTICLRKEKGISVIQMKKAIQEYFGTTFQKEPILYELWNSNVYKIYPNDDKIYSIGVLIGLAILNRVVIKLAFPLALFKKLRDIPVDKKDFQEYDPKYSEQLFGILNKNDDMKKEPIVNPNQFVGSHDDDDCFLPLNINTMKVGEIVEINMKIKESDVKIKVKFDLVRKTIGSKWIFCYTILGGEPFDILKQTLFVQLTRVNELETQVCIFTKIHENINSEMIIYLANKKKYVLNSLKDYFMNFYSYNSVNGYI